MASHCTLRKSGSPCNSLVALQGLAPISLSSFSGSHFSLLFPSITLHQHYLHSLASMRLACFYLRTVVPAAPYFDPRYLQCFLTHFLSCLCPRVTFLSETFPNHSMKTLSCITFLLSAYLYFFLSILYVFVYSSH